MNGVRRRDLGTLVSRTDKLSAYGFDEKIMPSRREVLVAGSFLAVSSFAGCTDRFVDSASLREVNVDLYNANEGTRTFHVALETEDGMLEWKSRTVDANASETVVIDPPEDAIPVALHGSVADFAGRVELVGLDNVDDDYCLRLDFYYEQPLSEETELLYSSDISC